MKTFLCFVDNLCLCTEYLAASNIVLHASQFPARPLLNSAKEQKIIIYLNLNQNFYQPSIVSGQLSRDLHHMCKVSGQLSRDFHHMCKVSGQLSRDFHHMCKVGGQLSRDFHLPNKIKHHLLIDKL
jgi:hypothetical protein